MAERIDAGRIAAITLGLVALGSSALGIIGAWGVARGTVRERMEHAHQPAPDPVQVALMRTLYAKQSLPGQIVVDDGGGRTMELPVLLEHSMRFCQPEDDASEECVPVWLREQLLDPQWPAVPLPLRRALVDANAAPVVLPDPRLPGVSHESFAQVRPLLDEDWRALRAVRPRVSGLLFPSRAVVSADGSRALLLVGYACEVECFRFVLFLFERGPAGWSVLERFELSLPLWDPGRRPPP